MGKAWRGHSGEGCGGEGGEGDSPPGSTPPPPGVMGEGRTRHSSHSSHVMRAIVLHKPMRLSPPPPSPSPSLLLQHSATGRGAGGGGGGNGPHAHGNTARHVVDHQNAEGSGQRRL